MGVLKYAVPAQTREHLVGFVNEFLPEGAIRDNLANLETLGGLGLVIAGAKVDGKTGLILRAIGEALDDIDGDTARALGIESEFGAMLDPITDKIKAAIELHVLWNHTKEEGFDPDEIGKRRKALGIIIGKQALNATLTTTSYALNLQPRSSQIGKINFWIDCIAIAAFGLSDVIEEPEMRKKIANIGYAAVGIGIPTGVMASAGYAKDLAVGLASR